MLKCSEEVIAEPPDNGINTDNLSNLGYDIVHFDDRVLMVSFHFLQESILSEKWCKLHFASFQKPLE